MDFLGSLWMVPAEIFTHLIPFDFLFIDWIIAHFLTFCFWYIIIKVVLAKF